MRGSGWALFAIACLLWLAAVGVPAAALLLSAATPGPPVEVLASTGMMKLLATSAGWACAAAIGAMLAGWIPGRLLGRAIRRGGYVPLAALMLAPICLPAYVIFYAWWQSWPAGSALFEWAAGSGRLAALRAATLAVGLVCWSWPIVAWSVAASASASSERRGELLLLDGAGLLRRVADRLRGDARGLSLGGLIVLLVVLGDTTSFDIALISTFGSELRAIDALGAGPGTMLKAALPATVIAAAGAASVWMLLRRREPEAALRPARAGGGAALFTGALLVTSAGVPIVLFAGGLSRDASVGTFLRLYGADLVNTIALAAACGAAAVLVAVGLSATWQDRRPWVRAAGGVQAGGYLAAGLVPGPLVASAFEAAYNRPGLDGMLYTTPAILVLGNLARYGFIAALLARWVTVTEPRELADLRRLDGALDLPGYLLSAWPRLLAAGGAAAALVGVLSMGELAVTARLAPAGNALIASAVLNAVHYQRPDSVLLATVVLMAIALGAGLAAAAAWAPLRRWRGPAALLLAALPCWLPGCRGAPEEGRALPARATFGSPGRSLGQFSYPRAIAVDAARGLVYVVDKTARVQRFGVDGTPELEWRMPEWANGKPTGIEVAPDGRVFVADTHYHRVIAYDGQGRELLRFGAYGQGPGELIYPTDVAFGPKERIYVSEYGGNERVNVFDAGGRFLFSFGSPGPAAGQFNRPQALAFNASQTELFVADACNHRIVVVTPDGDVLRVLGGPGRGPGELAYPYDVMVLRDGTLLVCEFGNNRVQRLSPEGKPLGTLGRVGTRPGELQYPWGVDGTADDIFVLDSGNNRVQVIDNDW